jgi:Tol biopolymer transport system component
LPGTEGGFYPFWSPDNKSIGFFTGGKLKRIDIDGGLVRVLANAPNPVGGTWNQDGTILFTPNYTGPIFRTSAATSEEAVALTKLEGQQATQRFPQFLPDGRHFLYYVPTPVEVRGVYVGNLDGGPSVRLFDAEAPALYSASQHLVYVRESRLIAQRFDPAKLAVSGNPFPVADQVVGVSDSSMAAVSTSAAGPIAFREGLALGQRQFIWFDRSGKEIGIAGKADDLPSRDPAISPDGRRIGFHRTINGNIDIWMLDLVTSLVSRFTFDSAADSDPVWSPDGTKVAFNSNRKGVYDIYQKPANGSGNDELLLATPQNKAAVDWSPDGRFILFRSPSPATGFDLWILPVTGDKKPYPFVQTPFEERDGQFSPDGKWIAYQSNESGRAEILVQPFPGPGGKLQVSTNGGAQVRWRPDGKELFYVALDGRLMAVPIGLAPNKQSLEAAVPIPLFMTRIGGAIQGAFKQQYVVSADGQRFLMNSVVTPTATSPVTVILNWQPKQ